MRKETTDWLTKERFVQLKRLNSPKSERGRDLRRVNFTKLDYRHRKAVINDLKDLAEIAIITDEDIVGRVFTIDILKPFFEALLKPPPPATPGKKRTDEQLARRDRLLKIYWSLWRYLNTWTGPLVPETAMALGGSLAPAATRDPKLTDNVLAVEAAWLEEEKF